MICLSVACFGEGWKGREGVIRFFMRKDGGSSARLVCTDYRCNFDLKGTGLLRNEKGMRGLEG